MWVLEKLCFSNTHFELMLGMVWKLCFHTIPTNPL